MVRVREGAEGGLDVVPALLILQSASDELRDEGAAPAWPDPAVQVGDKLVV